MPCRKRRWNFITARHDLGVASGLDLAQQQALLDASNTQLELLQNQRSQYEHAVATMTGNSGHRPLNWRRQVVTMTPPMRAGRIAVGCVATPARRRVRRTRDGGGQCQYRRGTERPIFPTILLQPSMGWDSNQMGNLLSAPSSLWSLRRRRLTQTLFDAGKTNATVKIAESSYTASVSGYRQSVLVAMQEVEDGIDGMNLLEGASNAQADRQRAHSSQR